MMVPEAFPGLFPSHHASGAWIEISLPDFLLFYLEGRITQVVRGLKLASDAVLKKNDLVASRKWCVD